MISTTHPTLNEALKVIRREQPRQFSVCQGRDDVRELVWQYSRPVEFYKEGK